MKMRLIPFLVLTVLFLSSGTAAFAQVVETILIPIALQVPQSGAYNSLFKSEVWVVNTGEATVTLAPGGCRLSTCFPLPFEPGQALVNSGIFRTDRPFGMIYVVAGSPDHLTVTARIQDISRQGQTWGTEIPVVRQRDLRTSVQLVDIPTDARFRQTLRIYSFAATQVRLRIFSLSADLVAGTVLVDEPAHLTRSSFPGFQNPEGYFQILNLVDAYPQLRAAERLRIEISSMGAEKIWGFVSVTNNETQHVTTITPQQ